VDKLAQHEAKVAAVLDAGGVPEADPEGVEWDDLDAKDSEYSIMVSEHVVDIFKYLKGKPSSPLSPIRNTWRRKRSWPCQCDGFCSTGWFKYTPGSDCCPKHFSSA
jgi:hypothetical protein